MNRQQAIKNAVVALSLLLNGGEGSGNWGHMGGPGKRGGSGAGTVGVSSNNIRKILDSANKNGGMTIDIHGNTKREGIAFAPHKDSEAIISTDKLGAVELKKFIVKNIDKLRHPDANLGGWKNPEDGKWYLDISHVGKYSKDTIKKAQQAEAQKPFIMSISENETADEFANRMLKQMGFDEEDIEEADKIIAEEQEK